MTGTLTYDGDLCLVLNVAQVVGGCHAVHPDVLLLHVGDGQGVYILVLADFDLWGLDHFMAITAGEHSPSMYHFL